MTRNRKDLVFVVVLLALVLAACGQDSAGAEDEAAVTVEQIAGSELSRITVSQHAAERLAIETTEVDEMPIDGATHKIVPHAAVLWDSDGQAWTYTAVEATVFVRAPVTVLRVDGDTAVLDDGPDTGTRVVIVGASELWGAETGVGGGH
jgi:hypothetical protein